MRQTRAAGWDRGDACSTLDAMEGTALRRMPPWHGERRVAMNSTQVCCTQKSGLQTHPTLPELSCAGVHITALGAETLWPLPSWVCLEKAKKPFVKAACLLPRVFGKV